MNYFKLLNISVSKSYFGWENSSGFKVWEKENSTLFGWGNSSILLEKIHLWERKLFILKTRNISAKFWKFQAKPSKILSESFHGKSCFAAPAHHLPCFGGFQGSFFKPGSFSESCFKSSLIRGIILIISQPKNCETCLVLILWYDVQCDGSHT